MKKTIYEGEEPLPDFDEFIRGIKEFGAELVSGIANPRFGSKIEGCYNLANFGICLNAQADGCGELRPLKLTAIGSEDSIGKVEKIILDEINEREKARKKYEGAEE